MVVALLPGVHGGAGRASGGEGHCIEENGVVGIVDVYEVEHPEAKAGEGYIVVPISLPGIDVTVRVGIDAAGAVVSYVSDGDGRHPKEGRLREHSSARVGESRQWVAVDDLLVLLGYHGDGGGEWSGGLSGSMWVRRVRG